MHITFLDNDNFIIYLNKNLIKNVDFDNNVEIENYFKKLFLNLKKIYSININGYYDIKIYKDKMYGIVIEVENEEIEYMDLFDNQVEMSIEVINDNFIYKIDDYFFLKDKKNISIFRYKNKIYLNINGNIALNDYLKLIEFGSILYGEKAKDIVKKGVKIQI